jgi:carbonic anhydrase
LQLALKIVAFFVASLNLLFAMDPQEGFDRLMEGNRRYVADDLDNPDRSSLRREEIYQKQNPFAVIVGCSDSRVPPEIVFDQGLGDLFVVRVAGQVVGPVELDSIEYSLKYLGSTLVLVLGHESCGAIRAVLDGNTALIEDVADLIKPALKHIKDPTVDAAVKANVRWVVKHLKKTPLIKQMVKEGKIAVIGGFYCLADGHVEVLQ